MKALMAAGRDGLLAYMGLVTAGIYEVDVAGRRRQVSGRDALGLVERLRAIEQVGRIRGAVRLADLSEDGTYIVVVDGQRVELAADHVMQWCAGYAAAYAGGTDHAGVDHLGQIRRLVEAPTLDDQCRMVILGLMKGGPVPVSVDELAERIGKLPGVDKPPAKKTLIDALSFGGYLASDLAEKMIAAFGLRWVVTATRGPVGAAGGVPQMPGVARLRQIVAAADAGWLRYVDRPEPNKSRWHRQFRLAVGEQVYVVPADGLTAWLDGMRAWHDQTAPSDEPL